MTKKALVLISGGLDSIISLNIIQKQGIECVGISFYSPFFSNKLPKEAKDKFNFEYHEIEVGDDYIDMLKNPPHGYGTSMNPCIDCKIYMMKKAKELMEKYNASFIVSGEVLGQRPMSQHKEALLEIERKSGLKGILVRPLSALYLEPTIPEIEGIIDRKKLLAIEGRGRKTQLGLINNFDNRDFSPVGGGCILTDKLFKKKFDDLVTNGDPTNLASLYILKFGRHFRYGNSKIIVGRNKSENESLIKYKNENDYVLSLPNLPAPTVILQGEKSKEALKFAADLLLYYSDSDSDTADIECIEGDNSKIIIKANVLEKEMVDYHNIAID